MQRKANLIKFWSNTILHSYSQLFFSLNKLFAVILILVTFFDIKIGFVGFLSVILINIFAVVAGLNKQSVEQGIYGFNALLLGIVLGFTYQFNTGFWILFFISVLFLLVATVWLEGFFAKEQIPFLVFPFLLVYWTTTTSAQSFKYVLPDINHLYGYTSIAPLQHSLYYQFTHFLDTFTLPAIFTAYFKTLNGIFFQDTILGGLFISIGLLIHSRIAFSLSIIGFAAAYLSFRLLGADTNLLTYHLLGSNFILMAIAIGSFYIIPNVYSYIIVILLTPILMMLLFFIQKVLFVLQLSGFTISFSILVTMFLYFLHQRWLQKYLQLVTIQYYSPEKTIYKHISSVNRFENKQLSKIALPFFGTWKVSQGYSGKITHLEDWSNALDFVIVNEQNKTYKNTGTQKEDFYCYNKPVLAPMDGTVHSIVNTTDDNDIADVNTQKNWGNTIIINHTNGLFSQISHIKKDSFKVNVGDYVSKGTALATCGNSGRSPEPHIHFQMQQSPKIGAKTIAYPIAYFIEQKNNKQQLKISEIPTENTLISNVETTSLLSNALNFIPGKKIKFKDEAGNTTEWEVFTDAWNRTYIYCEQTQSYAYFTNDDTMIYFYDFEGDKDSLLFYFYLAFYRILLGYYEEIHIEDQLPLIHFNSKIINFVQDIFAPFYLFTNAKYQSTFTFTDDMHSPERIEMKSSVTTSIFKSEIKKIEFDILFKQDKIQQFIINKNHTKNTFICVP